MVRFVRSNPTSETGVPPVLPMARELALSMIRCGVSFVCLVVWLAGGIDCRTIRGLVVLVTGEPLFCAPASVIGFVIPVPALSRFQAFRRRRPSLGGNTERISGQAFGQ